MKGPGNLAPLLSHLQFIARAAVRRVYNDPVTTVHVERCVLGWLMHWDPTTDQPIRAFIGLKAGNEARKCKAMTPVQLRQYAERDRDLLQLQQPRER